MLLRFDPFRELDRLTERLFDGRYVAPMAMDALTPSLARARAQGPCGARARGPMLDPGGESDER
jgi:hypothetical protein